MSQTVVIPSDVTRLEVEINGVHYTYTGGETVTVPDSVAYLILNNAANKPSGTRPVGAPLAATDQKGNKEGVPVLTDEQGNLYADSAGVAEAALSEIYVDGHKAVIPDGE